MPSSDTSIMTFTRRTDVDTTSSTVTSDARACFSAFSAASRAAWVRTRTLRCGTATGSSGIWPCTTARGQTLAITSAISWTTCSAGTSAVDSAPTSALSRLAIVDCACAASAGSCPGPLFAAATSVVMTSSWTSASRRRRSSTRAWLTAA